MKKKFLQEKKKAFNQKEKKALFTVNIEVFDDETTQVTGPIENPLLMLKIFAAGQQAVVHYNMSLIKANADKMAEVKKEAKPKLILS